MAILKLEWALTEAAVAGCPSVMTADEGTRIIVGTSDGDIVALDGASNEVWRTPVGGAASVWPVIDQIPGFGKSILAGTDHGDVVCLSPDGEVHWTRYLEGGFTHPSTACPLSMAARPP